MTRSRAAGWLALGAALVWLYYDRTGKAAQATTAGYVSIALMAAHIWLSARA